MLLLLVLAYKDDDGGDGDGGAEKGLHDDSNDGVLKSFSKKHTTSAQLQIPS